MKPIVPGELGILKLVFGRSRDGNYEIKHPVPLRLQPLEGDPADLFKLRDDIVISQPNYLSTISETLRQSIVPIVAMVRGESAMRCLGTGFFVSATGLLITAAHVVTDPIARNYGGAQLSENGSWSSDDLQIGIMLSRGRGVWTYRPIKWAEFLNERPDRPFPVPDRNLALISDIAICQVEAEPDEIFQPLVIIQSGIRGTGLAVGKAATAIGYGGMQDTTLEWEAPRFVAGDFSFDLHVSTGSILEHLPDNLTNRQAMTPGPCFRASLKLPGGMSGSPIFDSEGIYVHGVVSSGSQGLDGLENHGHGSMLAASMQLPIRQLDNKTLLELMKSREHGMPQFSMPGA